VVVLHLVGARPWSLLHTSVQVPKSLLIADDSHLFLGAHLLYEVGDIASRHPENVLLTFCHRVEPGLVSDGGFRLLLLGVEPF